jgi:hypothetical protein
LDLKGISNENGKFKSEKNRIAKEGNPAERIGH